MLIPAQNLNKANYKILDCFANRQIKEDVKCNNLKFYNFSCLSFVQGLKYKWISTQEPRLNQDCIRPSLIKTGLNWLR
jgi:hypothetical protein